MRNRGDNIIMNKSYSTEKMTLSVKTPTYILNENGTIKSVKYDVNNGVINEKDDVDFEDGDFIVDRDDVGDVFFHLVKKFAIATKARNGSKVIITLTLVEG